MKTKKSKKEVVVSVRLPIRAVREIDQLVEQREAYNRSDFVRKSALLQLAVRSPEAKKLTTKLEKSLNPVMPIMKDVVARILSELPPERMVKYMIPYFSRMFNLREEEMRERPRTFTESRK